jgi:hypothetical protein
MTINLNLTKDILKLVMLIALTYLILNITSQARISVPATYKTVTEDSAIGSLQHRY